MGSWSDMSSVEKAWHDYYTGKTEYSLIDRQWRQHYHDLRQKQHAERYGPRNPLKPAFCWKCQKSQHVVEASTPVGPRWRCKYCGMWVF